MNKNKEFDDILNECLERLISGETIEACLAAYPEHADELEPLLRTFVETREVATIEPRPEFRETASRDFQAAIRDMESVKGQGFFAVFPRWATVLTSVVIVLLAATGTAYASLGSLPDEPLYQVKLATESVRLAFTPSELGKAELYAEFADERVNEIVRMADEGKVEQVEEATERMNDQLIAMASLVAPADKSDAGMQIATYEAAEPAPEPAAAPVPAPAPSPAPMPAAVQEEAPAAVIEAPPKAAEEPVDIPAPTIEVPPVVPQKEPFLTAPRAAEAEIATEESGRPGWEVGEGEIDDQARLRIDVFDQAWENVQELEELLERAPEALKPLLKRAIEVARNGYENVLQNLE